MGVDRARVLILVKGLGIGGAERLIASGSAHWDSERYDYQVAYVLPWKDALVPELEELGVTVTCIGGRRGFDPLTPIRWRQLVRGVHPDLIHAHLPSTGILARLVGGVPVVYTEHNIADSYRAPTRILNRLTYGRNAAVIAVSEAVKSSVEGFPGPEVEVIENGVATQVSDGARLAARKELGLGPDDALVVHVGNIRPHKGHQNLVDASESVLDQRPDVHIVSIGGEKYPGDLARLREEARARGIEGRLRFLGSRPDALDFIAAADVFVNPADVEGLPVAILEAQSLAKPVVATAVGGVPSVVIDGETGRLVPPGEPQMLADALLGVIGDLPGGREMGKRAHARVNETHGLERMIRGYESVYERLLGMVRQ